MARAFLKLYAVTGDRKWLRRAEEAAQFIEAKFKSDIGYIASVQPLAGKLKPKPQVDENAAVARTLNLLRYYTGKEGYEKLRSMRCVILPLLRSTKTTVMRSQESCWLTRNSARRHCTSPLSARKMIPLHVRFSWRDRVAVDLQTR